MRAAADFNMVTTRLATGAAFAGPADSETVRSAGITHIVDCRAEGGDDAVVLAATFTYLWLPTQDDGQGKAPDWWDKGIQFALDALSHHGARVLCHCFPTGTLVDGPIPTPIESAEHVYGHDGRLHKVVDRMTREYAGDLVTIDATGSGPIRCTPEHPILVVRPYRFPGGQMAKPGVPSWRGVTPAIEHYRDEPRWLSAEGVRPGDFLVGVAPRPCAEPTPVPVTTEWHKNARDVGPLDPDDRDIAWAIGQYVADGSSRPTGICYTTSRRVDADRLAATWTRVGARAYVIEHGRYQRVLVTSAALGRAFRSWCGSRAGKRFPAFVFDGWPLDAVLAGYLAGDGYVSALGEITATTISPVLARQVHTMLRGLGESPTLRPLRRSSGYANASPGEAVRFRPGALQRHTAWWRGMYLMPVRSTGAQWYDGLVHNIAVADAETYSVSGAVVHNCAAGVNRGPSMAMGILMALGWPADGAEALIRAARPQVGLAYAADARVKVPALGWC